MMNKTIYWKIVGMLLIISMLLPSCSDVLLADLSTEKVTLLAPANQLVTAKQSQTFWWEEMEDADSYTIQIVSPSFDSISQLIAEIEITEGLTYETVLNDGVYQWTVIGSNGVSKTERTIFNLTIASDSTENLSQQTILLVSPENGLETNETDIDFLWQSLDNVNLYHFQLASPDFSNSSFILEDVRMVDDLYLATLTEGVYQWRVRGENDLSVTPYTTADLIIDLTAPNSPTLDNPVQGDTLSFPILMSWTTDSTSEIDTLFIYPDSLNSAPILSVPTNSSNYTFSNQPIGQFYFWRVRSVDKAGNASTFSPLRKFYVMN